MTPLRLYVHATNPFGTHFVSMSQRFFMSQSLTLLSETEKLTCRLGISKQRAHVSKEHQSKGCGQEFTGREWKASVSWATEQHIRLPFHPLLSSEFSSLLTAGKCCTCESTCPLGTVRREGGDEHFVKLFELLFHLALSTSGVPDFPSKWQILERPRRPNIGKCHRRCRSAHGLRLRRRPVARRESSEKQTHFELKKKWRILMAIFVP